MKKTLNIFLLAIIAMGCDGFLDEKPLKSLVVPSSLTDLQALMDYEFFMNTAPGIPVITSDEFYASEGIWQSIPLATLRNAYIWKEDDLNEGEINPDWIKAYEQIFYTNIVLESIEGITRNSNNAIQYDHVKGNAIFHRILAYYHLLSQFSAMPQDGADMNQYGLVIKETAAIESPPVRITVGESYDFIENELIRALDLLPETSTFATRPSKASVYALQARFYLFQGKFIEAEKAAEEGLKLNNFLIDHNDLDPSLANPFQRFNQEVIFHEELVFSSLHLNADISPELYDLYQGSDLRRETFFNVNQNTGRITFKGSYNGMVTLFGGFTTAELYLILAECQLRNGKLSEGLATLNIFRSKRYLTQDFEEIQTENKVEALRYLFLERRKELALRGARWFDLRRLNHEEEFKETLTRTLGGITYTLEPNSRFYILPIMDIEIATYGLLQNP
ncbi:RagB/SusD family nutrient uptake outer membrane protein [Fontibacter flavus]|uniref:RagB/SusD family nutrient uptake outer membrane protein n=1 Tax=Fontibacter flavus TaxID=654838 RepID=A0ABV6FYC3_9BACT